VIIVKPTIQIREYSVADMPFLEGLYSASFPDEDLLSLVTQLLNRQHDVLSLCGVIFEDVIAHIVFTICTVENDSQKVALLGPVCVHPNHQSRGYGKQIIGEGLNHLVGRQISAVCVLGDPKYYERFGFSHEKHILPPYPLPKEWCEAWQSLLLYDGKKTLNGILNIPEPWQRADLWS
jgi:putative acetyltransferase